MREEIKLKPCPFCGSSSLVHFVNGGPGNVYVKCCCGVETSGGSKERVTEIWNRRCLPVTNPLAELHAEERRLGLE